MIALLNPKPMKDKSPGEPMSFCIENEASFMKIGVAQDFDICHGHNTDNKTLSKEHCHSFVNRSIE